MDIAGKARLEGHAKTHGDNFELKGTVLGAGAGRHKKKACRNPTARQIELTALLTLFASV
jgi:hypothetical protein